jgi:hypothetical protein
MAWCSILLWQGYILYSYRKKLKAELVGKSPNEIKELRLGGMEVTETYQVPGHTIFRNFSLFFVFFAFSFSLCTRMNRRVPLMDSLPPKRAKLGFYCMQPDVLQWWLSRHPPVLRTFWGTHGKAVQCLVGTSISDETFMCVALPQSQPLGFGCKFKNFTLPCCTKGP